MNASESAQLKNLLAHGWQALKKQQIKAAIEASQQLNRLYANDSEGWYFTAQVALSINNQPAAEQALNNAINLAPDNHTLKLTLANIHLSNGRFTKAKALAQTLQQQNLNDTTHNQLAYLFSKLELNEQAISHYQKAIELNPDSNEHHYSLATVLRHSGELAAAEIHLNKAVELNPMDIDAHTLKVDLYKQSSEKNSLEALQQVLTKAQSPKDRVQLHFALAKSYEDLEDYENSFSYLSKGNQLRREHINYQLGQDKQIIESICSVFNQNWWQNTSAHSLTNNEQPEDALSSTVTPVFILGMPRTGSTLAERILTAPDNVISAGELNEFAQLLTAKINQLKISKKVTGSFIKIASQVDFKKLGQEYLTRVTERFNHKGLGTTANYLVDKLPFNYLYIGLIKKALPHAKIIHVKRHPMDTCYAIYKTLFQNAYPFSYDQQELADYYILYRKLMEHWSNLPELEIHQVNYEELVKNPKDIGQKMFQFCQQQWCDDYAKVQQLKGTVNTASASQVRQKIHQGSVNKWKHYQQQLAPLKHQLEQAGVFCD